MRAWCSGVSMVVHRNIQLSAFSTVLLRSRSRLLSFPFKLVDIHVPSTLFPSSRGVVFRLLGEIGLGCLGGWEGTVWGFYTRF